MKASAPKKLYVDTEDRLSDSILYGFTEKHKEDDIEYIRKDAFIEKTLAYLNEKFYFNNLHYAIENNTFNCMEEMFEDFENYIKGE